MDSSWTLKFAGWKLSISFQIASIYGYLYVKLQWGKSKKSLSSFDISMSWKLHHESRCICPIGQLGDIFSSCTSYQMLLFQSLFLSLLSCVCCFFLLEGKWQWFHFDPPTRGSFEYISHDWISPSQSGGPIFCHNAVNFRCGNWICPFYEILGG